MSGFDLRDQDRYRQYAVTIEGISDCAFEIETSGFGERFSLEKDGADQTTLRIKNGKVMNGSYRSHT